MLGRTLRTIHLARRTPCARPSLSLLVRHPPPCFRPIDVRGAASSVSGRPGSQTPGHAAQNIKEEIGNSTSDLAKSIAGANVPEDDVKPINRTFVSIVVDVQHVSLTGSVADGRHKCSSKLCAKTCVCLWTSRCVFLIMCRRNMLTFCRWTAIHCRFCHNDLSCASSRPRCCRCVGYSAVGNFCQSYLS